jgi:4a-hydroxytetrahydrobiopterin dehydratase
MNTEKMSGLPDWILDEKKGVLTKTFHFKSYLKNISFVNAIAWAANKENHHPDLYVIYNQCVVNITTHDAGGLTEKDFKLAKAIEELL